MSLFSFARARRDSLAPTSGTAVASHHPQRCVEPLENRVLLADAVELLKDLNTTTPSPSGSFPKELTEVNGTVYFTGETVAGGRQLWATNGTAAGTRLVKDLNPAGADSPGLLTNFNGTLYFLATDGTDGTELWKSDGTEAGTVVVADVDADPGNSDRAVVLGDVLLFSTGNASRFWRTDGTAAGTFRFDTDGIRHLAVSNGLAYFASWDPVLGFEPWKTDGTLAGTSIVKDLVPGNNWGGPSVFVGVAGARTVFTAEIPGATPSESRLDLYVTDGTPQGTAALLEGGVSTAGAVLDGVLYFARDDVTVPGLQTNELWRTDGTAAGTWLVRRFADQPNTSNPSVMVLSPYKGRVFFSAYDEQLNRMTLWTTDGTAEGTTRFKDIFAVTARDVGGTLYLAAEGAGVGFEPYRSDGTPEGTVLVKDTIPGPMYGSPIGFAPTSTGRVVFDAYSRFEIIGRTWYQERDLYTTDGTPGGTTFIRLPDPSPDSSTLDSNPRDLTEALGDVFFVASNGRDDDLFRTDGTRGGTLALPDGGGNAQAVVGTVGGAVLFAVLTDGNNSTLWRTDGTAAGTAPLVPLALGTGAGGFYESVLLGDTLYFSTGSSFWKTDGTAAGTVELRAPAGGRVRNVARAGGKVYFFPHAGGFGEELFTTDGTVAGTRMVKDINPGTAGSLSAFGFAELDGEAYFVALHAGYGHEIWKTDGTAAGTALVKDVMPGPSVGTGAPSRPLAFNGAIYFSEYDALPSSGGVQRLWRSDGTADGTVPATNVHGDLTNAGVLPRAVYDGHIYFNAVDPATPGLYNLYKTDGAPGGRTLLRRNLPVFDMKEVAGKLYLLGNRTYGIDPDLWVTDGTPEGTRQVTDIPIAPNTFNHPPGLPAATDSGILVFAAGTPEFGVEPWRIVPGTGSLGGAPGVVGRGVFYQGSPLGWRESDLASATAVTMAPDKRALLPGQAASFANVTSYSRGINGIVVDLAGVGRRGAPTAADFAFRSGGGNGTWAADVPAPTVTFLPGAGAQGSDRVVLTWPDYNPRSLNPAAQAIANEWLEVTVRPGMRTGLSAADVFYFGNLIGETGDRVGPFAAVGPVDWVRTRGAFGTTAPLTSAYDFDRSGAVTPVDLALVRANLLRHLRMFTAPAAALPPADPDEPTAGWTEGLLAGQ